MREKGKRSKNIISSFSYPLEKIEVIELAEEEAKSRGMSLSQYIVSTFEEQQHKKNEIGQEKNPIQVTYHATQEKSTAKTYNTLDYFIEKGFVTKDYFREELRDKPIEQVQRISALGRTINEAAEIVISIARNGKYTIH